MSTQEPPDAQDVVSGQSIDPILQHGLQLVRDRYCIFPAQRATKEPQFGVMWTRVASDSESDVRAWRERYPGDDLVWGISCGASGIVAIDGDGGRPPFDPAISYRTPRGGWHALYSEPRSHVVGNDNRGKLAAGVDVKGLNGYVIAWGRPQPVSALPPCPPVVWERLSGLAARSDDPDTDPDTGQDMPGQDPDTGLDMPGQDPDTGLGTGLEAAARPPWPESPDGTRTFSPAQAREFVAPAIDRMIGTPVGAGLYQAINDAALLVGHFVPAFFPAEQARAWLAGLLTQKYERENVPTSPKGDALDLKWINIGLRDSDWKAQPREESPFERAPEPVAPDAVEAMLAEMLDSDGLDAIEDLEPVVKGWLWKRTVARINGKSGHGKSFVALDIAGHVGSGTDWQGAKVPGGTVVYAVAEGTQGFRKRVRAWERFHEKKMTGVRFLPRPVQVGGTEWATFIAACKTLDPALIILDTQARVTVGVNENDNTEMGIVVHQADVLMRETGACVTFVHHLGHQGEEGRGATAVKAALQTEILVKREGRSISVSLPKQKDDADNCTVQFGMHVLEIDKDDDGEPVTSCVLVSPASGLVPAERVVVEVDDKSEHATKLIGIMMRVFNEGYGGTEAQIRQVFYDESKGATDTKRKAFKRAWNYLIEIGKLRRVEGRESYKFETIEERLTRERLAATPRT